MAAQQNGPQDKLAALPALLLERLEEILPERYRPWARNGFLPRPPVSFRVNTLRGELGETLAELRRELDGAWELEPVPWCADGFWLHPLSETGESQEGVRALQATAAHERGAIYIQGTASMAAAPALGPQPGEAVLDLCAAPGGKTLHLAALMQSRAGESEGSGPGGRSGFQGLVANDRSRSRFFKLKRLMKEHGAEQVECRSLAGESFGRRWPASFDRVLLDAPCSSEARMRSDRPETFADWKPHKIKRLRGEQMRLLWSGLHCLRPGGVLLYSTCTLAPEENEHVVHKVLRKLGGEFELEPIELIKPGVPTDMETADLGISEGLLKWRERSFEPSLAKTLRIWPTGKTTGFFLARFRRR